MSTGRITDAMYQSFMRLLVAQDNHQWNRVTWSMTLEIAVLGGAWTHPNFCVRIGLPIVGLVFIIIIGLIVRKDQKDRKQIMTYLDEYHGATGPVAQASNSPAQPANATEGNASILLFSKSKPSGGTLIALIFVLMILLNVFSSGYHYYHYRCG